MLKKKNKVQRDFTWWLAMTLSFLLGAYVVYEPLRLYNITLVIEPVDLPLIRDYPSSLHTRPRSDFVAVRTNERIVYQDADLFCLAKNIFHEAGIESDQGKLAVAQVTINRVFSDRYPNTICEVVMQPYQFSWTNDSSIRWTRPQGPNWEQSREIAQRVILAGKRLTGFNNVYHYHAHWVAPPWSDPDLVVAEIGNHIFYGNVW